jgi:hypothetical protein
MNSSRLQPASEARKPALGGITWLQKAARISTAPCLRPYPLLPGRSNVPDLPDGRIADRGNCGQSAIVDNFAALRLQTSVCFPLGML